MKQEEFSYHLYDDSGASSIELPIFMRIGDMFFYCGIAYIVKSYGLYDYKDEICVNCERCGPYTSYMLDETSLKREIKINELLNKDIN